MPQRGDELMISGKNPGGYFCENEAAAAAVPTDSSMSPARK